MQYKKYQKKTTAFIFGRGALLFLFVHSFDFLKEAFCNVGGATKREIVPSKTLKLLLNLDVPDVSGEIFYAGNAVFNDESRLVAFWRKNGIGVGDQRF